MVPDGWKNTTLGKVMEFKNGINTDKSQYGSGLKFVNVMDVLGNDILTEGKIIGRVQVDEKRIEANLLKFGDVLFNRTSETYDEVAMAAVYLDDAPATFGGFVIRGRPYAGDLQPEFSAYVFRSSLFRSQVIKLGQGAVRANIGQKDLAKVVLLTPPLSEQKKIAKILSAWDKTITTTEKLLANSQQHKKALMQQLLTGNRHLSESGAAWREYKLGELFKERVEIGHIHLPLLSITSDEGVIDRGDVGRKDTSNADKAKYLRICPNDIGYNTMRMWQGVSGLSDREGLVSPAYTVLIPQDGVDSLFASYLFKLPELVHIFYRYSQGLVSDTWNLKYSHFSKIAWRIPPIEEQLKIARTLKATDGEIETLRKELYLLKQEKKALMQQLLTGKRRVKVGE